MDALVYDDTPLASYLGDGHEDTYEARTATSDISISRSSSTSPGRRQSFAPHGLPDLSEKIRNIRRSATHTQLQSSEQILEEFRYVIVASQLLTEERGAGQRLGRSRKDTSDGRQHDKSLLQGTIAVGLLSFALAWTLHWARSRTFDIEATTWTELLTYCLTSSCLGVALLLFSRRQYAKYVQRKASESLSKLIENTQSFDSTTSRTTRFIQEVELVARGYDLGSTLSPITRLEDKQAVKRCQHLRSELVEALTVLISLYVTSHHKLQGYVVKDDLARYHDIYEISQIEFQEAEKIADDPPEDHELSLKELRFALRAHEIARRTFLCDLLSLQGTSGWYRVRQWRVVAAKLRDLQEATKMSRQQLDYILDSEEYGTTRVSPGTVPDKEHEQPQISQATRNQLRPFDDLQCSIRQLNAKLHLIREELSKHTAEPSLLKQHYNSLDEDIRSLQTEYERGRSQINFLSVRTDDASRPNSLSPRTPLSPSLSTGSGIVFLDSTTGTPADALRALNGDKDDVRSNRSSDATLFDEDVFETITNPKPRQRMSMSATTMTREEKLARLAEDRRKRATMQAERDLSTGMLKELKMVIKHRPGNKLSEEDQSTPTETPRHQRNPSIPLIRTPVTSRISSI